MKIINKMTIDGITLIVKADRESKRYVENGVPKVIDLDYMLYNINSYKENKQRGVFTHEVYAIAEEQFNKEVDSQNKWVAKESFKITSKDKGGITAILTNQIKDGTLVLQSLRGAIK